MGVQNDEEDFSIYSPYKKNIFEKEDGTFLGRDFYSWSKIGIFYVIFYTVLVAFFSICMWVVSQTLDPRIPKLQQNGSLIGMNPGMGFRPMPDDVESTLIWLQDTNFTGNRNWIAKLDQYLDVYYTPGKVHKTSSKKCSYTDFPRPGEVCAFDVNLWGECTQNNKYLFHKNTPCIFLKLNRIYGWIPDFITHEKDFPRDMPEQLRAHIKSLDSLRRQTVWISCEGETPTDVEYLGPVRYYPNIQGFPGYYYPYLNAEGYLSPLIAVHFVQPKAGIVINVECKAWAKNIVHSKANRLGSVHFELLIN